MSNDIPNGISSESSSESSSGSSGEFPIVYDTPHGQSDITGKRKYKLGAWTKEDRTLLKEKVAEGLTWEELEEIFNRPAKTIRLYSARYEYDGPHVEDYIEGGLDLRRKLKKQGYYVQLEESMSEDELALFEELWINLMLQFREDLMYSEELQLKQYLNLEILAGRSLKERYEQAEVIDRLQTVVDEEYAKDMEFRDMAMLANYETQLSYAVNSVKAYTNEHKTFLEKSQQILKDLKATRDQRVKRVEDSKESWQGLIRSLEDEVERTRTGRETELMKMAKDKAEEKMTEYHQYSDGELGQPLLNHETVIED